VSDCGVADRVNSAESRLAGAQYLSTGALRLYRRTSKSYGCFSCGIDMKKEAAEITLRPFERSDFKRLISWVPTPEAHGQWCGSFFRYPLDESRLQRYLDSASRPNTRAIFTALLPSGRAGRSCRDQQYLVVSVHLGIGAGMVSRAVTFSFDTHHVDRIDLGVDIDNLVAIRCYRRQGFEHVGTWPHAMEAGPKLIDVYWMTLSPAAWVSRSEASGQ
jgi:RimJ/RimL family protein N-acetyltransferase